MKGKIKNIITRVVYGTDTKGLESVEKGKKGEVRVKEILTSFGIESLENVYIPRKDKKGYTEIDLIGFTEYGILVIEVKNYKANIKGNIEHPQWEARYPNGDVYEMYNPIKQNRGHKYGLEKEIGRQKGMDGLVVFAGGKARVSIEGQLRENEYIMYENQIKEYLRRKQKTGRVYTKRELKEIKEYLERYTNVGYMQKRRHIYNVNKK